MIKFVILGHEQNYRLTPGKLNDSERTCFENIKIDAEYPIQISDCFTREPARHVAS